tara:strand:- start:1232 stop:1663 length:432 start_codon:yes stop_codon:yes gene_type:complete
VIAFRVHEVRVRLVAKNLPRNDETRLETGALVAVLLLETHVAQVVCRLDHVLHVEKIGVSTLADVFLDLPDDALSGREVAGRQDDELAAARIAEGVHLRVRADVVHARVRARIGHQDDAGIEYRGSTIGHGSFARMWVGTASG